MAFVLFLTCLGLSLVFLVAGLAKLADLPGSRATMRDFGVSASLANPAGTLLPLAELIVAGALLVPIAAWWGAVGALVLLLLFVVGISYNLARGRTPDCHCFGQLHSAPAGWSTLLRNLVLAALAGLVIGFARNSVEFDLGDWLGQLSPTQRVELIEGLVVLAGLIGILWLLWQVLRQQGRRLLRLEAVEARLAEAGLAPQAGAAAPIGLEVGAPAPAFSLTSVQGETLRLADLLAGDKPVLLLFADPGCGPCAALFPEVGRWQRDYASKLTLAVISRGSPEANQSKASAHGISRVLLQQEGEVQAAYQGTGTPSAVLIGVDGTIGSRLAQGAEDIRSLVADAIGLPQLRSVPMAAAPVQQNGNGAHTRPRPPAPAIGEPAPEFSLPDLSGKLVKLSDFRGSQTLVLFWRPSCGFCQRMLPDLQACEAQSSEGAPRLLVVSSESVADNQAMGLRSLIVLDQAGRSIGSQFGASGTPMAVLVDAEGRIASELVAGAPAVLALARRGQEKTPLGLSAASAARAQKTKKKSTIGMSRAWGIQTVYLPRENLRFLEEWLAYHSQLGAEYFYLYDNTGSRTVRLGNCVAINGKNKYGIELDFRLTDDEIADIEAEIFKNYPVTKVKWQPQRNGEIIYGPVEACDHFSDLVQSGWCAFIDMDKFLYSPYEIGDILEGKAMVLLQKKFDDRFSYNSALEITKTFSMKTDRWGSKVLINMEHYIKGGENIHDLNVHRLAPLIAS